MMPIKNMIASIDVPPPVIFKSVPVLATESLAALYGVEEKRLRQNYSNNKDRFVEGKHFFKVTGAALRNLQVNFSYLQVDLIDSQISAMREAPENLPPSLRGSQISSKTRSLMLWTERGAARHAKMLNTDQAWDVFEKLEDAYFEKMTRKHDDWKRQRHETAASHKVMSTSLFLSRTEQGKETKAHHYSNEAKLVNWALTGAFKGIDRDTLPYDELNLLAKLEAYDSVLIGRGHDYDARKLLLNKFAKDWRDGRLSNSIAAAPQMSIEGAYTNVAPISGGRSVEEF